MSTKKTNEELVAEIQKGINTEENKVQLYKQNRKLIIKVAKKYFADEGELEDYISEGYFAIDKACDFYDLGRGASFSTVLYSCLQNCYRDYLHSGCLVRIPRYVRGNSSRYNKVKSALITERGEADDDEIMEKSGLKKCDIEAIKASRTFSTINSLDEPVLQPDGGTTNLAEVVADDYDLEKDVTEKQAGIVLWECVGETLKENRVELLKMHYKDDLSVSQIAKIKGVSRQAISSMIISSMERLRKSRRIKNLHESL